VEGHLSLPQQRREGRSAQTRVALRSGTGSSSVGQLLKAARLLLSVPARRTIRHLHSPVGCDPLHGRRTSLRHQLAAHPRTDPLSGVIMCIHAYTHKPTLHAGCKSRGKTTFDDFHKFVSVPTYRNAPVLRAPRAHCSVSTHNPKSAAKKKGTIKKEIELCPPTHHFFCAQSTRQHSHSAHAHIQARASRAQRNCNATHTVAYLGECATLHHTPTVSYLRVSLSVAAVWKRFFFLSFLVCSSLSCSDFAIVFANAISGGW
jgi:hypothetical protein